MRRVTYENNAVMDKAVNPAAVEIINADPVEFEGTTTNNFFDARYHIFRFLFFIRIGIGT